MGSDKEMEKNNAYSRNTELYIVARQKKGVRKKSWSVWKGFLGMQYKRL